MLKIPDAQGLRVLVVDDEADARELLTTVLEEYGACDKKSCLGGRGA